MVSSVPALEYSFDGAESAAFGKPTSVDTVTVIGGDGQDGNRNRSKDSAFIPPAFGSPSADTKGIGEPLTPNISGVPQMQIGGAVQAGSTTVQGASGGASIALPPSADTGGSTSGGSATSDTASGFTSASAMKNADGSIGRLKIPSLGVNIKVYNGETLANMKKGAAHYASTSGWDGNVAMCAHNRGVNSYFGKIHTLEAGDKITYTTKFGTRTYQVYSVYRIDETDTSCLNSSVENILTLTTCVRNVPELRWCVRAKEV